MVQTEYIIIGFLTILSIGLILYLIFKKTSGSKGNIDSNGDGSIGNWSKAQKDIAKIIITGSFNTAITPMIKACDTKLADCVNCMSELIINKYTYTNFIQQSDKILKDDNITLIKCLNQPCFGVKGKWNSDMKNYEIKRLAEKLTIDEATCVINGVEQNYDLFDKPDINFMKNLSVSCHH